MKNAWFAALRHSVQGKLDDVVFRVSKRGKTYAARTEPVYVVLAAAAGTYTTAYRLAFSEWWHGTVIHEVCRRSKCIRIGVLDNVHMAKVRVTISDDEGNTLEHVSPKNPGADVVKSLGHKLVILTRGATFVAIRLLKRSGCNHPFVEGFAADAERVLETLVQSGAITINGY